MLQLRRVRIVPFGNSQIDIAGLGRWIRWWNVELIDNRDEQHIHLRCDNDHVVGLYLHPVR